YADAQGNVELPPFEQGQQPLPVDKRVREVAAGTRGQFSTDETVQGVHVRVLTVRAFLNTIPITPIAVQIELPLTDTDSTLSRLAWILFFVALGGVGLAVVLGWLVTRAALAPVRRLSEATAEITETRDLGRRVQEGGSDELGRLGMSFNTMLAALEESQQAQRQLVADASHELRTPLTSLRTNVELLAQGRLPEDERRRALADVSTQLEELTVLVTDVVDLARGGRRRGDGARPRPRDRRRGSAACVRPLLPLARCARHAGVRARARDRAPGGRIARRHGQRRACERRRHDRAPRVLERARKLLAAS